MDDSGPVNVNSWNSAVVGRSDREEIDSRKEAPAATKSVFKKHSFDGVS